VTGPGLPEAVHLVVPAWGADVVRDRHSRCLRDALRAAGVRSEIFAREPAAVHGGHPDATSGGTVGHATDGDASGGQLSVRPASLLGGGPDSAATLLVVRVTPEGWRDPIPGPEHAPVVLDCHGLFAPEAVAAWDPRACRRMAATLDELGAVRSRTVLAVADCEAGARLLGRAGIQRTAVAPALGGIHGLVPPDPRTLRRLDAQRDAGSGATWVTFGGVHPLAWLDRAIQAVWAARRFLGLDVALHILGAVEDVQCARALRAFASELDVSSQVRFAGAVTPAQESAYLEVADVVCDLSPCGRPAYGATAALRRGAPVVAVRGGTAHAVVDGAGLLVGTGVPIATAQVAQRVQGDPAVRQLLADAARVRSSELEVDQAGPAWVDLLVQAVVGVA